MISISDYYHGLIRDLIKSFSLLSEKYDEDTIHDMRLLYKRIRTLHKFIGRELNGKEFLDDQVKRMDIIYQNAGLARELHINRKLLNRFKKPLDKPFGEFAAYLDSKMADVNSVLHDLIKEIDIASIRRTENKRVHYLAGTHKKDVFRKGIKFMKRKAGKIDSLVSDRTDKKKYHEIRTNIRDVLIFLKLFFTGQDFKKLDFELIPLKKNEKSLGVWHDKDVLLVNLHTYFKTKHITNYNRPNSKYKSLIDYIDSEQDKLIRRFDRKIMKSNLELSYFIGKKEIDVLYRPQNI